MNERDEEMTGRALGQAIESQRVRETPFAGSRLAAELEHPRGAIFPVFRLAAAFAVVVLAVGALYVTSLRSSVPPAATPTPSPSGSAPVVVPSTSPAPTGTPLPGQLNHSLVYCARAGAPPFAIGVAGINGATPEQRIQQRLQALEKLQPLGPTQDGPCPMGFPSPARILTVEIKEGALAFVDFAVPGGDWKTSMCLTCPLVQEIVYTVTEEPGVTQALIRQNGGPGVIVDGNPANFAASREDVLGYAFRAPTAGTFGQGSFAGASATTRWSVDEVAAGLTRFVVELSGGSLADGQVDVQTARNDEAADPNLSKQVLTVTVHGASIPEGQSIVDKAPLRAVVVRHEPGSATTVHFALGLDDLRPWRVALIPGSTTRIVVDIGGGTGRVTQNLAVYSADVSGHTIHVTGAARSFEAHVPWRVKDAGGAVVAEGNTLASIGTSAYFGTFDTQATVPSNVSGNVTLDVFLTSARDGSITEIVSVPLVIR